MRRRLPWFPGRPGRSTRCPVDDSLPDKGQPVRDAVFPVTPIAPDEPLQARLTEMTEMERAKAMARFAVLRPFLDAETSLARVATDAGVSTRTAQRWLARYRANGLPGLVRHPRMDAGRRKIAAEVVATIEGMALRKPRPSIATIYRRLTALARDRGWTVPSLSSVHAIVSAMDPAMLSLTHDGPAVFRDRYELVHRFRSERPNAIWQTDHTQLDVLILDAGGKTVRPWLTVVIDDYSRAIADYTVFLGAPSALQTSLALRQAIWRKQDPAWVVCGIPDVLYVDHGSDFTSTHLEQVAADLRMRIPSPRSLVLRGAARLSVCSELSIPNSCPSCPAASSAADRRRHRVCRSPTWTRRSANSLSATAICAHTRAQGYRRGSLGLAGAGSPACPTA